MKKILLFLVTILFFTQASAECNLQNAQKVTRLIAQRAQIMKSVAAAKWLSAPQHQTTPYDAHQELMVLLQAQETADSQHFNTPAFLVFTQIQMDLSKQIEAYWIEQWNRPHTSALVQPTAATTPTLAALRAQIQTVDQSLWTALQQQKNTLQGCKQGQLSALLNQDFLTDQGRWMPGVPEAPNYLSMLAESVLILAKNH